MKTPSLYETYRAWNELYDDGNRFVGYTEDVMFRAMKTINAAIPDQIKYCHVMDQVFLHEDEYLPFSQFHLSFTNEKAQSGKIFNHMLLIDRIYICQGLKVSKDHSHPPFLVPISGKGNGL